MKILWLYKYIKEYDFDNWLHMKFVEVLAKYPDVEVMAYGPNLHIGYPKVSPLEYNNNITLHEIRDSFKFDIIIINTKSRCFDFYNPKKDIMKDCWLPKDFNNWKYTKKVVIEEDYHYEKDDLWYKEVGIDLILQRHYSQTFRKNIVPMRWLPFSVDTEIFNPEINTLLDKKHEPIKLINSSNRKNILAFIGNDADAAYIYRKTATNILTDKKMAVSYSGSKKVGIDYINILREYIGYISCGSVYEISAAKNFEIMASGGILLTNMFKGIELLFPEGSYVSYRNDWLDISQKANIILNEKGFVTETRIKSLKCIKEYHSHKVRIKELLEILRSI